MEGTPHDTRDASLPLAPRCPIYTVWETLTEHTLAKHTHTLWTQGHRPNTQWLKTQTHIQRLNVGPPAGHRPLAHQRKRGLWMATFQYNNIKVSTKIFVTFYFTVHCISGVYWFKKKHGQMIMIHLLRSIFKSTNMYHVVWSTVVSKCVAFQPTDRAWNRL